MKPHKCPVCGGTGQVPYWYYYDYCKHSTGVVYNVQCRSCNGTGIVWEKDSIDQNDQNSYAVPHTTG